MVNVSEGRRTQVVEQLAAAAGPHLLDVHRDADHHRSVLTLAGPPEPLQASVRQLAAAAVASVDLRCHHGAHPRLGALDVVPFIPLGRLRPLVPTSDLGPAVEARDRFAEWAGRSLAIPCYLYGPLPSGADRSLPELRRAVRAGQAPDTGPLTPVGASGVIAVGARQVLVAYNLWLQRADLALAKKVAARIRAPGLRALGLQVGNSLQVSCNLIEPWTVGPLQAYQAVSVALEGSGATVSRGELVGLIPQMVLETVPAASRATLGLDDSCTIESRLEAAGLDR